MYGSAVRVDDIGASAGEGKVLVKELEAVGKRKESADVETLEILSLM